LATARIAEKLNVQVLGLGGLTGTVGEAGKRIAEESNLPVTNGTTFAAGACLETVLRAAELRKINLSKSEVAIIGATNSIGKICAYVLSKLVAQLSLVAKSEERLTALFDKLKKETRIQIENLGCDVDGAIHNADIVIFTTSAIEVSPHIETESLKKSAIICDIPMPRNISPDIFKARPDILVIDGAAIEPPCELRLDIDTALAENQIYACMAETMILTMEGRLENFSLGWEPSLEKLEQIRLLAAKHGFKPAFTSFGQKIV
jgi:predicted amino acid dehydrogenase